MINITNQVILMRIVINKVGLVINNLIHMNMLSQMKIISDHITDHLIDKNQYKNMTIKQVN